MSPELTKMFVEVFAKVAKKHPKAIAELMASGQNGQNSTDSVPPAIVTSLDVLTLAEAATYLRVPESDLRIEAESGRLKGRSIGGDWRFVREDVLKWVRSPRPKAALRPELEETEEEFEAFLAVLRSNRDEVDRATKSGKYAEDE